MFENITREIWKIIFGFVIVAFVVGYVVGWYSFAKCEVKAARPVATRAPFRPARTTAGTPNGPGSERFYNAIGSQQQAGDRVEDHDVKVVQYARVHPGHPKGGDRRHDTHDSDTDD